MDRFSLAVPLVGAVVLATERAAIGCPFCGDPSSADGSVPTLVFVVGMALAARAGMRALERRRSRQLESDTSTPNDDDPQIS